MMNIPKTLEKILSDSPLIIGIGNELRGDDAAGIKLISKLQDAGFSNSLNVSSNPENYLVKISRMPGNCRLWVDTVNWNSTPGTIRIFTADESQQFAISTHNFSPKILFKYLQDFKNIPDYLLGIQPQSIELGSEMSEPVRNTVDFLVEYFLSKTK